MRLLIDQDRRKKRKKNLTTDIIYELLTLQITVR